MSMEKYSKLSGYKSRLDYDGTDGISSINNALNSMNDIFRGAVKGDYYSVQESDFYTYIEKYPSSDNRISNTKTYINNEMQAILRDIEEEERKKREAAQTI